MVQVYLKRFWCKKENFIQYEKREKLKRKYEMQYWEGRRVHYYNFENIVISFTLLIDQIKEARVKVLKRIAGY